MAITRRIPGLGLALVMLSLEAAASAAWAATPAAPKARLLPYFEPNAGQAQAVPHGSYDAVVTRIDTTPLPVSAPLASTDRRMP